MAARRQAPPPPASALRSRVPSAVPVPPPPAPLPGVPLLLAGEPAHLLPARALWLPHRHSLLVADLHWGKAAAFRAAHLPLPSGTTAADLERLSTALADTGATRLIVLGDLWHSRAGRHPDTLATIAAWRARHATLTIDLVRGNHDRHAGDPPACWEFGVHDPPLPLGPLTLVHDAAHDAPEAPGYRVGGHLHPHRTLTGPGRERLRLPCFVVGPTRAVLPAFGAFTGGGMHVPQPGDRHYAIADGDVLPVD
jgi:DNA ligase-associated metallophosphoesterase